jgi:hypothetical protein
MASRWSGLETRPFEVLPLARPDAEVDTTVVDPISWGWSEPGWEGPFSIGRAVRPPDRRHHPSALRAVAFAAVASLAIATMGVWMGFAIDNSVLRLPVSAVSIAQVNAHLEQVRFSVANTSGAPTAPACTLSVSADGQVRGVASFVPAQTLAPGSVRQFTATVPMPVAASPSSAHVVCRA